MVADIRLRLLRRMLVLSNQRARGSAESRLHNSSRRGRTSSSCFLSFVYLVSAAFF
jgi:hypothetical protein